MSGELSEVVEDYRKVLLYERGYSPASVKSYRWSLRCLAKWMQAQKPPITTPEQLTEELLHAYYRHLSYPPPDGKGYRPRTLRVHWGALKGFVRWVDKQKRIEIPLPDIVLPSLDDVQRRGVTDDQLRSMEAAVERIYDPQRCALARAMFQVMISAALRISEMRNIKLTDLSLKENCLWVVRGKGGKSRKQMLNDKCIRALKSWLEVRPKTSQPWLWMRTASKRMGPGGITELFRQIEAMAGYKNERILLAHNVRHNSATRLYRNTRDLEAVRIYLGHKHLATTQVYLDLDEERMTQIRNLTDLDAVPEIVELADGLPPEEVPAPAHTPTPSPPSKLRVMNHRAARRRP
jgi:site-specific recombinase XerD